LCDKTRHEPLLERSLLVVNEYLIKVYNAVLAHKMHFEPLKKGYGATMFNI